MSTQVLSAPISSLLPLLVQTQAARWKAANPEQLTGAHLYLDITESGYLFHGCSGGMAFLKQCPVYPLQVKHEIILSNAIIKSWLKWQGNQATENPPIQFVQIIMQTTMVFFLQFVVFWYCSLLAIFNKSISLALVQSYPDSKVHWANMGPTWCPSLGPTGPRWAPCWSHELCYLGMVSPVPVQQHWRIWRIWVNICSWYTKNRSYNNKAKHNKTMCLSHGIYYTICPKLTFLTLLSCDHWMICEYDKSFYTNVLMQKEV